MTEVDNYTDGTVLVTLPTGEQWQIDPGQSYLLATTDEVLDGELYETQGTLSVTFNYGTADQYDNYMTVGYWAVP
jgi:hypothetical protein